LIKKERKLTREKLKLTVFAEIKEAPGQPFLP